METPIRAKLTLEVEYVPGTASIAEVRAVLHGAADHLANHGLLSGDGPAEVETWSHTLEVDGGEDAGEENPPTEECSNVVDDKTCLEREIRNPCQHCRARQREATRGR